VTAYHAAIRHAVAYGGTSWDVLGLREREKLAALYYRDVAPLDISDALVSAHDLILHEMVSANRETLWMIGEHVTLALRAGAHTAIDRDLREAHALMQADAKWGDREDEAYDRAVQEAIDSE
jgi:hypothetical protein